MPSIHTLAWSASTQNNGLATVTAVADAANPSFEASGNNITMPNRDDLEFIGILGGSSVTAAKLNRIGLQSSGGEFGSGTAPSLRWTINSLTAPFLLPRPIPLKAKSVITGYLDNTNTSEVSQFAILVRARNESKIKPLARYASYRLYDIGSLTGGTSVWTTDATWTLPSGLFDTSKVYHVLGAWGSGTDGGFGRFTDPMSKSVYRPGFRVMSGPAAALLASIGGNPMNGMITADMLGEVYAEFKGDKGSLAINLMDSAGSTDHTLGLLIGEVP